MEDDALLARSEREALEHEGYAVRIAADGDGGLDAALHGSPDLVILDVGLPGMDGLELLRRLKAARPELPVLIASARDDEFDRVLGLEMGGDDYLTKPFSLREMVARVRARLRAGEHRHAETGDPGGDLALGDARIDLRRRIVARGGRETRLTTIEAALLDYLARRKGRDVGRQELLEYVWEESTTITPRKVDNVVKKLRAKIEADPSHPRHILTVHGKGYRLEP